MRFSNYVKLMLQLILFQISGFIVRFDIIRYYLKFICTILLKVASSFYQKYNCQYIIQFLLISLFRHQNLLKTLVPSSHIYFSLCLHYFIFLIKLYLTMSQSEPQSETRASHLQQLFNRAKPKSRYISQSHIEEQTNSITKQIINGDIEVRRTRGNLDLPSDKNSYDEMLRRKFVEQIEKQKEQLQHKLGYIENSLVHFEKYDFLKRRLLLSGGGESGSRRGGEEWRREFEDEMKRLEQKKREMAQRAREKESEGDRLRAKVQEQELARRKAELGQSIKKMKQRTQKRQQSSRQQRQKLKQLLGRKQLYHKLQQRFNQRQQDVLQQRKKKLAQIRQLKQPISLQQILQHQQRVLQVMKEKEILRNQEKKMISSRTRSYHPSYQSAFYKQMAAPTEQQPRENAKQKLQKMRQFSQQVKTKFIPEIDQGKRREMQEKLQHEMQSHKVREEKERQLLEKPKMKGLEYLELVKRMPKKKEGPPPSAPKTDRIQYKNYLGSVSVDMGKPTSWRTILTKGDHKVQTAQLLQFQSQKIQQKLKRKQEYGRVMKVKDDGSIDQEYYEMVKAKLDLLGKE